ncbi:MAG: type II toxin-antitoxin system VapC family toxin [Gaiella sp.]
MILADVNVLVYAHRHDAEDHDRYRTWLEEALAGEVAFGVWDHLLASFVRVVTHPRVFVEPTPVAKALDFARVVRDSGNGVRVLPGPRHWDIFARLCSDANAKGNLVADAYLAAVAIEHGCDWVTTDRDFSRFRGLRWRHPLHS